MLTRRHLRIKVLQALYAYFINNDIKLSIAEKNMTQSAERIYELAIYQLSFIVEIVKFAAKRIEENKKKFYPTEDDLNPNTKFVDNLFIAKLTENRDYKKRKNEYKINWIDHEEIIRRCYNDLRANDLYINYMTAGKQNSEDDKQLILKVFTNLLVDNESLEYIYEEKSVYWANDIDLANYCVVRIISSINAQDDSLAKLPTLYNTEGKDDPDEDKNYMIRLFHKAILHSKSYEKLIEEKASNWDFNRITLMDVILLKMGLAELIEFPTIPVKVTLNEIIELAKLYSTPKSRVFINGILDKMSADLKAEGRIVKKGRGLIE